MVASTAASSVLSAIRIPSSEMPRLWANSVIVAGLPTRMLAESCTGGVMPSLISTVTVTVDDSMFPAPTYASGWPKDYMPSVVTPVRALVRVLRKGGVLLATGFELAEVEQVKAALPPPRWPQPASFLTKW